MRRIPAPASSRRVLWVLAALVAVLVPATPLAQPPPDWAAVRRRAVAVAQEIDAAERRLSGAITAEAITALLRSERFTIEQLALGAEAARKDPAVLSAVIRHLLTRTEGLVLFGHTGDATYYRLLRFDEFTGEFEYRAGNTAPQVGRVTGASIEMPLLRMSGYGECKAQLVIAPALTASGTADCGVSLPVTLTFR